RRYGNCYTVHPLSQPRMVVFSDPDAVRDIFTADADDVLGGAAAVELLGPILGWNSLVLLDGIRYRRTRRLMMPTLHAERMHHYASIMRRLTDEALDQWPIGRCFSAHHELRGIVLEFFLHTIFGLPGPERARVRDHQGRILQMADNPVP